MPRRLLLRPGPLPPCPGRRRQDKDVSSPPWSRQPRCRGSGRVVCFFPVPATAQPPPPLLEWPCWGGRPYQAWPGVPVGSWKEVGQWPWRGGRGPSPAKAAGPASFCSFGAGGKEGAPYSCGSCYVLGEYRALMAHLVSPTPKRLVFCLHVIEVQDDTARVVQRLAQGEHFTPLSWTSS